MSFDLKLGDCREVMGQMAADGVDAIVTDPPYGLEFMGQGWDRGTPGVEFWIAALRVAKPGAHLVAFGGTRTYHRLTCAIEDAGWEIRDCLMWLYGSGFPKSLDVSKAIDKAAGVERPILSIEKKSDKRGGNFHGAAEVRPAIDWARTEAGSDAARAWAGWGTALKPAWEPIILARKPLVGTVAANVQEHGTGALNVDGCRVGATVETWPDSRSYARYDTGAPTKGTQKTGTAPRGRWPANVVLDEQAAAMLDEQSGNLTSGKLLPHHRKGGPSNIGTFNMRDRTGEPGIFGGDSGGASRFFYTSKTSSGERHYAGRNAHPTVKPVDLMCWLCRLVTPPRGIVLDPFMGSGSTGVAALAEGFRFLGIELSAEYLEIAKQRIAGPLFT